MKSLVIAILRISHCFSSFSSQQIASTSPSIDIFSFFVIKQLCFVQFTFTPSWYYNYLVVTIGFFFQVLYTSFYTIQILVCSLLYKLVIILATLFIRCIWFWKKRVTLYAFLLQTNNCYLSLLLFNLIWFPRISCLCCTLMSF